MIIAFEGLDQSGKETQARQLRARMDHEGYETKAVSFPDYETPIGIEIRKGLRGERDFGPDVMQLLYVANRFEYRPRIERWLATNKVVVCDRYRASSVAYGEAQGLDPDWLEQIQRHLPKATLTVVLDISPLTAATRKQQDRDLYERDLDMLGRVRASYLRQADQHGWIVIDAERSKEEVTAAVMRAVLPRLEPPSILGRS